MKNPQNDTVLSKEDHVKSATEKRLWHELTQASLNKSYLDLVRARKKDIEPWINVLTAIIAIATAVVAILDIPVLSIILTSLTALCTLVRFAPNLIPTSETFSKIDSLVNKQQTYLNTLESYWVQSMTTTDLNMCLNKLIASHAKVNTELSAIFGKISKRLNEKAQVMCDNYTERFE